MQDESEIAVRIHNANVSMKTIEKTMQQLDKCKEQLKKTNEALVVYFQELKKMKDTYIEIIGQNIESPKGQITTNDFKEENKRLRALLKNQIESCESFRVEAQNTIQKAQEEHIEVIYISY